MPGGAQNRSDCRLHDASKPRESPSTPHETPNITAPVRIKGVAPLSSTPTLDSVPGPSVLLPDPSLRCEKVKRTRRRGGVHERDDINTRSLRPSTTQNTSHHPQHRNMFKHIPSPHSTTHPRVHAFTRRQDLSEHQETPNITAPVHKRGWRLVRVRPWTEDGVWHFVFLPDHSLRHRRWRRTRRRGRLDGEETVQYSTITTPPHTEDNLRR